MDHTQTSPSRQRSRGLSFRSDKSGKVDLTESPSDKARRDSIWKANSKANPNAAINEAQPGVLNLIETTTLGSLREAQHKDVNGNVIVDPDLSNPTRPRLERPLDTIRAFEKAIDNGYKRRSTYTKSSEDYDQNNQFASRRSSYFGGGEYSMPTNRRRFTANGMSAGYESRPSPNRHASNSGGYYGGQRESYMGGQGGPPRQRYGNRMMSDSAMYAQGRPYPKHDYHQSQDTMNTGGSDSTGPWASGTDPSSENSSIDRNMSNGKQPDRDSYGYGQQSYGSPVIPEDQIANAHGGPVQPPPAARRPIALGNSAPGGSLPPTTRTIEPEEKKKGWLKRRFSKKG